MHDLADDAAAEGGLAGAAAAGAILCDEPKKQTKYSVLKCEKALFCIPDFVYD